MASLSQLVRVGASRRVRRNVYAFLTRFAYRRFIFALLATAVLAAKTIHIYAHLAALSTTHILRWGCSFYAQDTAVLLVTRQLLEDGPFAMPLWLRITRTALISAMAAFVLILATISISFWAVAGSELHWQYIGLAKDSSSWSMLMSGLAAFALVLFAILSLSWVLQDPCYAVAGIALDIILCPLQFLFRKISKKARLSQAGVGYEHISLNDLGVLPLEDEVDDNNFDGCTKVSPTKPTATRPVATGLLYVSVGAALLAQAISLIDRPSEKPLIFMSWTLPLVPFVDLLRSSPSVASVPYFKGNNITQSWGSRTALANPIPLHWLPKSELFPGFEDWYENKEHYRAAKDPLKISNLKEKLLPGLRGKLAKVKIQHVMLIELESTRQDVFPIKANSYIWDNLARSFRNKTMPAEIQRKLASMTGTASYLTGDYDTGIEGARQKPRGGINMRNAHTVSTHSLKSLVGVLCGLTPLIADFDVERDNHVYQPCLPHIFSVFNKIEREPRADDFTSFKWKSSFIQSATGEFAKQSLLRPILGYAEEDFITQEDLQGDSAQQSKANATNTDHNGGPKSLEDYITNTFRSAKENNERVFLSHLTSMTHHPFTLPKDEEYVSFADAKALQTLSHYVNSIGYADRWLAKILGILDKLGVANETLLILVGNHGLSVPENGVVTPYYNTHVGSFHVPLVLSHPKLPHVDIKEAAVSSQILPTVLDLLIETKSLSKLQALAAGDLLRNYEGQSFLRPLQRTSKDTGQANWLFTVMSPGGSMLAVRDARQPNLRLIVPIAENTEWRFTDLNADPHERAPILSFGYRHFLDSVQARHGSNAAKWIEEAASVSQWWIRENIKRWRYDPSAPPRRLNK